jgi:hypothetical protein
LLLRKHQQHCIVFGVAAGVRHTCSGNQTLALPQERVAKASQHRLRAVALLVPLRIGVGSGLVRLVAQVQVDVKTRHFAKSQPSSEQKLFCEAHAWMSIPSKVKCSSLMKRFVCQLTSAKNRCAKLLHSSGSRFLENTA